MDYDQHVEAVERESAAIAASLRDGPLEVTVPTCPDWTLRELATHLGDFAGLWAHVVCEGTGRAKTPFVDPPAGESRPEWFADWYEESSGHLIRLLRETEPDAAVWTWDPSDQTASFVARRAAHELAVHRFDGQAARSSPKPIDGPLAADGIEEIFAMINALRTGGQDVGSGQGETLHLHATDPESEWTLTLGPDGLDVDRSHVKSDLALRGTASDLELMLYGRPPTGQVTSFGDNTVLTAWKQTFSF
ncbi:MAG: maleylpyruvate isomerase family mycothiol-dependent enzyme [Actinomycetota bacterium]|nr:maleylpyruvate isomerase family mycothiol-dependent enzyme [Actinomycetota bacterium]